MAFKPAFIPSRQSARTEPLVGSVASGRYNITLSEELLRKLRWQAGTPLRLDIDRDVTPMQAQLVQVQKSSCTLHKTGGTKLRWQCTYTGEVAELFAEGTARGLTVLNIDPEALTFEIPAKETPTP